MELMTQLYIGYGVFLCFALLVTLWIIAGREIMFAFRRKIQPRGSDIFVHNSNRNVDRYYKIPEEDGNFKIKGFTYITNPDKVGLLGDAMTNKAEVSEAKRKAKLHKNIQRLQDKKDSALIKLEYLKKEQSPDIVAIAKISEYAANLDDKIGFLKSKLILKKQSYFMQRRSVYHYIEDDPIPKDMFEMLSEFEIGRAHV